MAGSPETTAPGGEGAVGPAGAAPVDLQAAQEHALRPGRVVVSCSAPLGVGGLGRHAEEIVRALERRRQPHVTIFGAADGARQPSGRRRLQTFALDAAMSPLTRCSPAWRQWKMSVRFDRDAARRLPAADHLIAFNGTALAQFRAAAKAGGRSRSLVCATAHMRQVARQHELARLRYPFDRSWAGRVLARNLREYELADTIYVSSSYTWESFVAEGVAEERLALFPLSAHPRYRPADKPADTETFDVLYVGGLTVDKGVPLLVDAVRRLPFDDLRLVLVGGWRTRGMRRFIEGACQADPRITVAAGDPLPRLRSARLYVHPAYCDGFAYSAAEALACGVPVLVSQDTGMKDLVEPGRNGMILPTGDLDALSEAIAGAYRGEVLSG
jgi:glycosyltransferase involved in cell wall biosynthesis